MGRFGLFVFLVVVIPVGVYWASHDFSDLGNLPGEIRALRGRRPTPETEPRPEPEPEPEPEPVPKPEPKPEPDLTAKQKPPEPEPTPTKPPTPPPKEPTETPQARAERLYKEGQFEDASIAYAGVDERQRALAQLGAAFVEAFPSNVPKHRYLVIKTNSGDEFEGFAQETEERITLTEATGKTNAFPQSAIRHGREVPRQEVPERIRSAVVNEGLAEHTSGPRLFALIQAACTMGQPSAVAPLLPRVLEVDETKPFFLSSVRRRVATPHQKDVYLAFATCQTPTVMSRESPLVRTPSALGNRKNGTLGERAPKVKRKEARALLEEAAPSRKAGETLYKKIVLAGDKASVEDVEKAIAHFDDAIALYEKVMEIEDSATVYALLRKCSKLNFNLRFWKDQLSPR
ncbi:MAG: hypothetical protein ACYTF8_07085 [Planctomycetota bacterium]